MRCLWLDGSIIIPLHSLSPRGYQPRVSEYDLVRSRFVCGLGVSAELAYRLIGNTGNVLALLVIQFSKIKQICFCIPKGKNGASAGKNFSKSLEFFKIIRISLDLSFLSAFNQQKCLYIPKGKKEACVRIFLNIYDFNYSDVEPSILLSTFKQQNCCIYRKHKRPCVCKQTMNNSIQSK